MDRLKAADILRRHNKWRRGEKGYYMGDVKELGEAIDLAVLALGAKLLNPDMPAQELRLHMGELTTDEMLVARAAIRWANSHVGGFVEEKKKREAK